MSEFSPQTQAVWDAAYNTPEDCPYKHDLATALEAVADEVVPYEEAPVLMRGHDLERLAQRQHTRVQLLDIAAELERPGSVGTGDNPE